MTGGIASQVRRVFAENRLAIVGALIIVGMVLFCFVGPLFYSTNQTSTQNALLFSPRTRPPSREHLLGTDQSGFDVLGRIMYGGQVSLEVGLRGGSARHRSWACSSERSPASSAAGSTHS